MVYFYGNWVGKYTKHIGNTPGLMNWFGTFFFSGWLVTNSFFLAQWDVSPTKKPKRCKKSVHSRMFNNYMIRVQVVRGGKSTSRPVNISSSKHRASVELAQNSGAFFFCWIFDDFWFFHPHETSRSPHKQKRMHYLLVGTPAWISPKSKRPKEKRCFSCTSPTINRLQKTRNSSQIWPSLQGQAGTFGSIFPMSLLHHSEINGSRPLLS